MSESNQANAVPDLDKTRPEDKVPLGEKIAYSMGVVSDHYANVCLAWIFMTPFFVDFLGLGATMVGLALGAARLWDAVTDPLAGRLSDGCKSRFGRRKPFIFVGAILTGLLFPVIWMVPDSWSTGAVTLYLFIALMIFYSVYSIFSVPYEALGAELTPDYRERSKIFVVRKYVQEFFNLGIVWIFPFAAWLATFDSVGSNANGIRYVSWLVAAIIIGAGILPALFNKERYKSIATKEGAGTFMEGISALARNKPLLIVIGVIAFYLFSIMATANLSYFVNVYYIYEGDIQAGANLGGFDGTLRMFFALAAAAVIGKLTDKVDKHKIMIWSVVVLIVAFVGIYFTTIPGRPWLALSMKPLVAIGECGFWVLILSMRADVCDWDEYKTGTRSEGLIAAITNWCNKIAMTLAIIISGANLEHVVQFDSKAMNEELMERVVAQAAIDYDTLTPEEKAGDPVVPFSFSNFAGWFEYQLSGDGPLTLEKFTDQKLEKAKEDADEAIDKQAEIEYASVPQDVKDGDPVVKFKGYNIFSYFGYKWFGHSPVTLEDFQEAKRQSAVLDNQKEGTMEKLRFFYSIPQAVALLVCLVLLFKYPLTRSKMAEIRAELERRRGVATGE